MDFNFYTAGRLSLSFSFIKTFSPIGDIELDISLPPLPYVHKSPLHGQHLRRQALSGLTYITGGQEKRTNCSSHSSPGKHHGISLRRLLLSRTNGV